MSDLKASTLRLMTLILLLALALRLIALEGRTLWYDEAFAVLFSEKGLNAMLYGTLTQSQGIAADVHPLLYYTTLGGWMTLFGESPSMVRLYGDLLSLMTVAVLYRLTRDLFNGRTGLIAALIATVAPFEIQYSQEARMYALLALLLLSATWCFLRAWESSSLRWWLAFGVLAGLAMYAQQLAAFYLLSIGLLAILSRRRDKIVGLFVGAGIAAVIYLPWLVNLPAQMGRIGDYWIPRPTLAQLLQTVWSFLSVELPLVNPLILAVSMLALVLLVVLLAFRALDTFQHRRKDSPSLRFALYLALIPVGLMWLFSQWKAVYLTRALLPSAMMLYIALAWLLSRARLPQPLVIFTGGIFGLTVILTLPIYYTWSTFPRPPFDAADVYLADHKRPGDVIVHANKLTALPMVYYNRILPQTYVRDAPGSPEDTLARPTQEVLGLLADDSIESAVGTSSHFWLVIFREQIDEEGGALPEEAWMKTRFRLTSTQEFNDLLIYGYELR